MPRTASVIGRYAYMIYDEGGLLDMNAAGYPSPMTILQYGRKGSLAFADLSGLPGLSPTPGVYAGRQDCRLAKLRFCPGKRNVPEF